MEVGQFFPGFYDGPETGRTAMPGGTVIVREPVIPIPQTRERDLALVFQGEILRRFAPLNDITDEWNAGQLALQVLGKFLAINGVMEDAIRVNSVEDVVRF